MQVNLRREQRQISNRVYWISWLDEGGLAHSTEAEGRDLSHAGIGVRCPIGVRVGSTVYFQGQDGYPAGYSVVRHCTRLEDSSYILGLELDEVTKNAQSSSPTDDAVNYYEFLQINPNAQPETIRRVYRFLAGRFHPDNPETGDTEKFLLLNRAYAVLSDPERRAKYDLTIQSDGAKSSSAFESVDFLDGIEGELNRRLAVLALLYRRCRADVHNPRVSLLDLEAQMGFPRDYLDFTTWYLQSKKYITREDNSDFALTTLGVDYVESNYSKLPLLRKLLQTSTRPIGRSATDPDEPPRRAEEVFIAGPADAVENG